jgi:hypothetical protein
VVASSLALALIAAGAASAQKSGGILKVSHFDSPASMSPLEEATIAALRPTMGVFNNRDKRQCRGIAGSVWDHRLESGMTGRPRQQQPTAPQGVESVIQSYAAPTAG